MDEDQDFNICFKCVSFSILQNAVRSLWLAGSYIWSWVSGGDMAFEWGILATFVRNYTISGTWFSSAGFCQVQRVY